MKEFSGLSEEPHVQPSEATSGSAKKPPTRGGFEGRSESGHVERSDADKAGNSRKGD